MAISTDQKVDYLFKKLGFSTTKTDINSNKAAPNESIPSPLLMRSDTLWRKSEDIPATIPTSDTSVVTIYNSSNPVECTADITATTNRTWKTGLTDWIPTEFGSTYLVNVYIHTAGDAAGAVSLSNKVFVTGSGNDDEWFFDYQSGVLNFIGNNLPSGKSFTGKSVYITGARYTGAFGVPTASDTLGNLSVVDTTISSSNIDADIILDPNGDGQVEIAGTNGFLPPVGTSAERPSSPTEGLTRYNSTNNLLEFYNGTEWVIAGPNAGEITAQTLNGDGSTDTFTLDNETTTAGIIVSINGTVQKPTTAYVVSGDQITFQEPPQAGDVIDVRFITLTLSFGDTALNIYTRTQTLALSNVAEGTIVYVSDGDSGSPCLAAYDGSNWKKITFSSNL